MPRILTVPYSLVCYAIGVATLVYLICFVGDLFVPYTVTQASPYAPAFSGPVAILWNVALIALWGLQHTIMASKPFKAKWTKIIPAAIERSTYLLFVAAMTAILVAFWVPVGGTLWLVEGLAGNLLLGIYLCGWVIVLISTFLINHFHLFGLQQAWQGIDETQSKDASFVTPLFYKIVRHPMMTGVLISLWAAPHMTVGRLVLNVAFTAYIIVGVIYEEKTLVDDLGDEYLSYRERTPSLIPGLK